MRKLYIPRMRKLQRCGQQKQNEGRQRQNRVIARVSPGDQRMADSGSVAEESGSGMMPSITKALPLLAILVPLVIHFVLVCFVLLAAWLPSTFLFSHVFLFLTGAWTVHHRQTLLPVIMYIVVVCVTILTDVIQLGLFFGDNQDFFGGGETQEARTWQFSAGMMIISLMIKPLTVALACVAAYLMSGASLPRFGLGQNRDAYDDVDQHHSPT